MAKPKAENQNSDDPEEKALGKLQYAIDRACNYLHDNDRSSYAAHARRAAKAGVDQKVVEAGLDAAEEALKDARKAIVQVYENPDQKPQTQKRVDLSEV